MVMRQVDEIAMPAGQTRELKVGGLHVMCLDWREELAIGDRILLTLTFEIGADMEISAVIRS